MAIEYPDDNAPMIPELIPNRDLIELRKTFGIDPQFLLSDSNQYYTNINDNAPIEKIDDGIASIDTGLPMYIPDGDNNFLQYSDEGAPAYIRDREPAAPIRSNYNPTITKIANFDEMFGPRTFTDSLGNVRTVPGEERFTLPKEKTGILQNIKDGGSKLLDFIKSGGVIGNFIKGILPEQDPRATFLRNYYGGEDSSNLTSTGSIASGLMAGYNPVSGGGLYTLTRGRYGEEPTYGLQNAYDRRIKAIENTLLKKYGSKDYKGDKTKLDERLAKLREEKRKEAEALRVSEENRMRQAQEQQRQRDDRTRADANQRYRDDPGAQSYSGGFDRSTNNYNDPFSPGDTE